MNLDSMSPIFCEPRFYEPYILWTYILWALHSIERAIHSKSPIFCAPYISRENYILYEAYILCALHLIERALHSIERSHIHKISRDACILSALHSMNLDSMSPTFCEPRFYEPYILRACILWALHSVNLDSMSPTFYRESHIHKDIARGIYTRQRPTQHKSPAFDEPYILWA